MRVGRRKRVMGEASEPGADLESAGTQIPPTTRQTSMLGTTPRLLTLSRT